MHGFKVSPFAAGRLSNIGDGLSNTILIEEKAGRPDLCDRTDDDCDLSNQDSGAWATADCLWNLLGGVNAVNVMQGPWSFHSAGAQIARCDGSVQMLGQGTDRAVVEAMYTVRGDDNANER
jgi:hypothetical protein